MMQLGWLEAQLLLRDRLFFSLAISLVLLAVLAGWRGGELARSQEAAIQAALELEQSTDADALAKAEQIKSGQIDPPWFQNPLNAQAWSYALIRHAYLPPQPLAGAAIADADFEPFLFRINPHPPDRWSNRASELTPSVAAYGGFDLAELILKLTPLLVLVAFADVIRDRSGSQRYRLSIVQSASEPRLLAQQLLPRSVLLMLLIFVASVIGVLATLPPLQWDTLIDSGEILFAVGLHTLFWIMLAIALVTMMRNLTSVFASFTAIWFVLGIMSPMMVEQFARSIDPPPSSVRIFAEERSAIVAARMREHELTRAYAETDARARDMLLDALERDVLLITPTNLLIQQDVDRQRSAARQIEQATEAEFLQTLSNIAALSPTLLARFSIDKAAGRDSARQAAFTADVQAYHAYLQNLFVPLLMRRATTEEVLIPESFEVATQE